MKKRLASAGLFFFVRTQDLNRRMVAGIAAIRGFVRARTRTGASTEHAAVAKHEVRYPSIPGVKVRLES